MPGVVSPDIQIFNFLLEEKFCAWLIKALALHYYAPADIISLKMFQRHQ